MLQSSSKITHIAINPIVDVMPRTTGKTDQDIGPHIPRRSWQLDDQSLLWTDEYLHLQKNKLIMSNSITPHWRFIKHEINHAKTIG